MQNICTIIKKIIVFLFISLFGSAFAAGILKDGFYSFDYERVLVSIDAAEMYKAYGMNVRQDVSKLATGAAVLVEDGTFVDPESGLILKVHLNGKVTSPDNKSIQGTYKNNGKISFYGTYTENDQTVQIVLEGVLTPSEASERAGKVFSGEYHATDPGTGRNQTIWIENGLYMWKYDDATEEDFSGWPMIVNADGDFNYVSEYTTRAIMYGLNENYVTSKTYTNGKFEPDGSLKLKIITMNSGTGQQEYETPVTYSAVKATEIKNSGNNPIYKAVAENGKKSRRAKSALVFGADKSVGTAPSWYSDELQIGEEYIIACGKKQSYESETALKLAEAIAVNQAIAFLGTEIKTSSEAGSIKSDSENQKYFYKTLENLTLEKQSYEVLNRYSDSNTGYIQIKMKKE